MGADAANNRQITKFKSAIPHNNNVDAEGNYVKDSAIVAGLAWSKAGFITFASDRRSAALRPWIVENPDDPTTAHFIVATQNFSPPNFNFHIDNTPLAA